MRPKKRSDSLNSRNSRDSRTRGSTRFVVVAYSHEVGNGQTSALRLIVREI